MFHFHNSYKQVTNKIFDFQILCKFSQSILIIIILLVGLLIGKHDFGILGKFSQSILKVIVLLVGLLIGKGVFLILSKFSQSILKP